MPQLSYPAEFYVPIRDGIKLQTIRRRRQDGRDPKPGQTLYHYCGPYRKGERLLARKGPCTRVLPLKVLSEVRGLLNGWLMTRSELDEIARLDGFEDWPALYRYIERRYGIPFLDGLVSRWQRGE